MKTQAQHNEITCRNIKCYVTVLNGSTLRVAADRAQISADTARQIMFLVTKKIYHGVDKIHKLNNISLQKMREDAEFLILNVGVYRELRDSKYE